MSKILIVFWLYAKKTWSIVNLSLSVHISHYLHSLAHPHFILLP